MKITKRKLIKLIKEQYNKNKINESLGTGDDLDSLLGNENSFDSHEDYKKISVNQIPSNVLRKFKSELKILDKYKFYYASFDGEEFSEVWVAVNKKDEFDGMFVEDPSRFSH